jgi:hypothetical protein
LPPKPFPKTVGLPLLEKRSPKPATRRLTQDAEAISLGVFACWASFGKGLAKALGSLSLHESQPETRSPAPFRTASRQTVRKSLFSAETPAVWL